MSDVASKLLANFQKEIDERSVSCRTLFQSVLQWFIFFGTISLTAAGLLGAKLVEENGRYRWIAVPVGCYIVLQAGLGVYGINLVRRTFNTNGKRIIVIVDIINKLMNENAKNEQYGDEILSDDLTIESPFPEALYNVSHILVMISLCVILLLWVILMIVGFVICA